MSGMTCAQLRESARRIARREATRAIVEAAREHCAACPCCAERLWEERRLSALLTAMSASAPLPARHVENELLASLRTVAAARSRPHWNRREWAAWVAGTVVAAALVIAVAVSMLNRHPANPVPPKARESERSVPTVAPPAAPIRAAVRPKHATTAKRQEARDEVPAAATEFIPMFYGDQRPITGPVVRVELPSPSGRSVQADVLIGNDGLARAVRFVQPN